MKNFFKWNGDIADEQSFEDEIPEEEYYESDEEASEEAYEELDGDEEPEEEYYESEEDEEPEEEYYESEEDEEPEEEYYESEEDEEPEEEYYESDEAYYEDDEVDGAEDRYYDIEEITNDEENDDIKSLLGGGAILAAGVCVVILMIITGAVFLQSRAVGKQVAALGTVGNQLDGIDIVGDQGLLAVADATIARQEALKLRQQQEDAEKGKNGYQEVNYSKKVTVSLNTVSIQKDLKIKFVNSSSKKLISNVPFSVTVTTPDKKSEIWSDDDMDGIIYKKGITPGDYKIKVDELNGEKYADYTVPAGEITAEVKKDIVYKKIDVSDEVKTESQINVATEEQKKVTPVVESTLTDTVEWVASTEVVNTYVEISKSSIVDPLTVALAGTFLRMDNEIKLSQTMASLKAGQTLQLSADHSLTNVTATTWGSSNPAVATVDGNGAVTAVAAGSTKITCTVTTTTTDVSGGNAVKTYAAECDVTVEATPVAGTLAVNPATVSLYVQESKTTQITASGFESGRKLVYKADSNNTGIATATVDENGKVTVNGVAVGDAEITVSANYNENPLTTAPSVKITVKVTAMAGLSLEKTSEKVFIGEPVTLKVNGNVSSAALSAVSSDTGVATVAVDGQTVKVTGVKEGSAEIKVTVAGASATCAVTVKNHPKTDTSTALKDKDGNQLYVLENDTYRLAVYADYYKDGTKFFKKGEAKYTGWQTIDGNVYFFDKNGNKVTGEQVIQGAKYTFSSEGVLRADSGTMGIDVSKHNASIDWNAVKNSGVSYVIIRCGYRGYTQGSLVIDSKFEQNIKGATSAGLKVGVYFFSQAVDEVEAVQEASFVLDAVKGYKITYPIFLDVEYSGASGNKGRADGLDKSTRTAVCKAFCATVQSGGYSAGIYANKNWLEEKLDPGQLGSYKIWLAQYAASPTYAGRYDMWQYKATGRVSGITGNVDMDISYLAY
ncbi:MAG: Ig-like domain-containing protein [Lachnospiraceae bacterium]|nr:Ig-like domain-containing protein [Lachnospiraceae bacterium]